MNQNKSLQPVMPFAIGIASFAILAIVNEVRDFELWRNYALSGVFLGGATTYVLWRVDARVPHYIQWTIVAALLAHYGGGSLGSPDPNKMGLLGMHGINGAYHHFEWWDHLTHGLGIGASAMGIAYLLERYQVKYSLNWSQGMVWTISMMASLTAGVGVELYEYLGKTAFQTIDQGGFVNTMQDLHFNFFGASVGTTIAVYINRHKFMESIEKDLRIEENPGRNITPGMAGFIAFVTIPAMAAVYLAVKFFFMDIPKDDQPLYDPALQILTWAAVLATFAAPVTTWIVRRKHV